MKWKKLLAVQKFIKVIKLICGGLRRRKIWKLFLLLYSIHNSEFRKYNLGAKHYLLLFIIYFESLLLRYSYIAVYKSFFKNICSIISKFSWVIKIAVTYKKHAKVLVTGDAAVKEIAERC